MKKHIYSIVLMSLCATSLFAQGVKASQRENQGKTMSSPQSQGNNTMQNRNSGAAFQSEKEDTVLTIIAPNGDVFRGKLVNGQLQMRSREQERLERVIANSREGDVFQVQGGGVTASYWLDWFKVFWCVTHPADCHEGGALLSSKVRNLMGGKALILKFSAGGEAQVKVKDGKFEISARDRKIIDQAVKVGRGDFTLTGPNNGVVVTGPIELLGGNCMEDPNCPKIWWFFWIFFL